MMERKFFNFKVISLVLLIGLFMLSGNLLAQGQGKIIGIITDASSGEFLPGANIQLVGTYLGAASDRYGYYEIDNVPNGTYTLEVTYIGYKNFSAQVTVSAGNPVAKQNVLLESSAIQGQEVTVVGLREGQIKALNQQMTSPTIKNVMSREEMERFPDMNTAEALQRIPGVTIQRSLGEGRFVYLRGTEPRLTTVTVDGEQIASPQDEERYIGLDVINASQLASIDVTKALTPDLDGNAIGGTVNLVTRSAFDQERQVVKLDLGSGYSDLPQEPLYRSALTYSNVFGPNKNFGISVSANYYRNRIESHSDEMDWSNEDDVNGNVLPFALADSRFYDYNTKRDHYGVSGTLEYKINDKNRFFLRGTFNQRNDNQTRNMVRVRVSKGDYLNATTISKARLAYEMQNRDEIQKINSVTGGGKHQFGRLSLDYTGSYSYAKEIKDNPGQIKSEFQLDEKVNLALDLADPDFPQYTITNLDAGYQYDPSHWEIDSQDYRETFTSNSKVQGSFNFKYPYRFSGYPANLKFGGKMNLQKKDRDSQRWKYKWKGDQNITMDQFATSQTIPDFLQNKYTFGPSMEIDKFRPFFNQYRALDDGLREEKKLDDTDGAGGKYSATEDVYAAYAMTTVNIGNLMVLAGVRDEYTQTTYDGIELLYDDNGDFLNSTPAKQENSYNNIFPDIHLRYKISPRTNVRLAFTTGISRPNYFDLAPYRWVFSEDLEVLEGNPDLEPTTAINYDLLVGHYFRGIGVLSGGLFYKSLDKVSYHRFFRQSGGALDGYLVEQPVNGGSAKLYGIELNWMQQFAFLPGFFSGFGLFGNYTHTKSEANLQYRDWSVLPGQAGDVANVGFSYEKFGLTARLSLNYNGALLYQVGETADFDRYTDDHLQLDFSASYQIIKGLDAYVQMVNLTNEPKREYFGIPSRPRLNEYYDWWMRGGLKFSL